MILETIYSIVPHIIKNLFVSGYNFKKNRKRHGGVYKQWKEYYLANEYKSYEELEQAQTKRLREFLSYCVTHSDYYQKTLGRSDFSTFEISDLSSLPIYSKEDIRSNLKDIYTIDKKQANISRTGGTTGKSLEVLFRWDDLQERKALLDTFRERFGWKHGDRTSWFSGKSLLDSRDVKKNRYWKSDVFTHVDYYSTFHINANSAPYYLAHMQKAKPKMIVGFPSSIAELAKHGQDQGIKLDFTVDAVFPTAETLVDHETSLIRDYFGGICRNQYASSEGASFILECEEGKLHYEMLSGVIEVLDENDQPTDNGRMVITSFSTRGTPLIRYDIGDTMSLDSDKCSCGRKTPVVKEILGRINDYIYSQETGKSNLGNISNCVKYVPGIVKFQVLQEELNAIKVLIIKGAEYKESSETQFRKELVDRLGTKMKIQFEYPSDIPKTKIGKHQIVNNKIKHLLNE